MPLLDQLKQHARRLKSETYALYLAARHPETPWYARLLVAAIVAYVLSPIDLIPDFIPIIGYLDDLILIPIGISLAIKLIPDPVLAECRKGAVELIQGGKPQSRAAAIVIISLWMLLVTLCAIWAVEAIMLQ